MSNYHPLDVRHPANRNRERNSYLLDPPDASTYALRSLKKTSQAPSRRSDDFDSDDFESAVDVPVNVPVVDLTSAATRPEAAPWGASTAPTPDSTPAVASRRGISVPKLILFGLVAYVILNKMGLIDEIMRFLTRTGYEMGLF